MTNTTNATTTTIKTPTFEEQLKALSLEMKTMRAEFKKNIQAAWDKKRADAKEIRAKKAALWAAHKKEIAAKKADAKAKREAEAKKRAEERAAKKAEKKPDATKKVTAKQVVKNTTKAKTTTKKTEKVKA